MNRILTGYINIQHLPLLKPEDIRVLDVINLSFALVMENKVVCDLEAVRPLLASAKKENPKLSIVLSVGGWGAGGFSEAAATAEGRQSFAVSAKALVEKYRLDGIDIDWEYPCIGIGEIEASHHDKENFTLLLKEIRKELDDIKERHCMLNIAVGGDSYYIRCTNLKEAVAYLDYVHVMTYDLRGGFLVATGHHTNLYGNQADLMEVSTDHAVKCYIKAGVPREKLIIGSAYYSRMWTGVPDVNHGLMQMASSTGGYGPDFAELTSSYINKNGYTRFWDEEAKAPYLFNGDTFISYDDEESIEHKAAYVKKQDLAGMMFWEYGLDTTYTLTGVMAKALQKTE